METLTWVLRQDGEVSRVRKSLTEENADTGMDTDEHPFFICIQDYMVVKWAKT